MTVCNGNKNKFLNLCGLAFDQDTFVPNSLAISQHVWPQQTFTKNSPPLFIRLGFAVHCGVG